jgi:hypothetical protein
VLEQRHPPASADTTSEFGRVEGERGFGCHAHEAEWRGSSMTDFSKKLRQYERDNYLVSSVILASIDAYGGEGSLMVTWARIITGKSAEPPKHRKLLPLFEEIA